MTNTPAGAENATASNDGDHRPADGGGDGSVRAVVGRAIGGRVGADVVASVAPIPGSIVEALCRVQASIGAVAKTQFNRQGNYKFASTDDIYAAVARKFGEAGLMIYPIEMCQPQIQRVEKTDKDGDLKVSQWGRFQFGYILATATDTWFDARSSRTIFIQILGPQTFNAAESYCQKQYLRALLKLPTGDMDLDSLPQEEADDNDILGPRKRKSSSAAKKDGTDLAFNELRGEISGAETPNQLDEIRQRNWSLIEALPSRWRQIIDAELEDKYLEMRPEAAE